MLIPPICRPQDAGFFVNPKARRGTYGDRQKVILDEDGFERARDAITKWDGYAPTPLVDLPGLAREIGVARVVYKDESGRFGLGSFKALGGAYAVQRQIEQHGPEITVCCATDGNHGRSVAWGAQRFGCRCVIYIHAHVSDGRKQAIEHYGAEVRRVPGTYDDSVRQAAEDADREGWIVVSDTSYPGYDQIPKDVMQGYTVMAEEALDQMGEPPTHVFIQGGVGGLAAAVCFRCWQRYGENSPAFISVEPELAACLFESAKRGQPSSVEIVEETVMAGLSCGEPSIIAWEILEEGCHAFMTVPDHAAFACMRLLAKGVPPIVAGESAVAGLAGAITASLVPELKAQICLTPASTVIFVGSEGATDPDLYDRIINQQ